MVVWNELPIEIQDLVLDNINNTHTICQARLVCHKWKNFWGNIPWYQDDIKLGYFFLKSNHFWLEDLSSILIREIRFKSYGRWCYKEFTPLGNVVRKIENKSFFMTESTDNSNENFIKIRKVDSRAGSINEIQIPKNMMMIPQCIIS